MHRENGVGTCFILLLLAFVAGCARSVTPHPCAGVMRSEPSGPPPCTIDVEEGATLHALRDDTVRVWAPAVKASDADLEHVDRDQVRRAQAIADPAMNALGRRDLLPATCAQAPDLPPYHPLVEAISALTRAYDLYPHPSLIWDLAQVRDRLDCEGIPDRATTYALFEAYRARAPARALEKRGEEVARRLAELDPQTSWLGVACEARDARDSRVTMDGDRVEVARCPTRVRLRVNPGRHVVGLSACRREIDVPAGRGVLIRIDTR